MHKIELKKGITYDIEIGGVTGSITPSDLDIRLQKKVFEIADELKSAQSDTITDVANNAMEVITQIYNKGFVEELINQHGLTVSVFEALLKGVTYAFDEYKKVK